MGWDILGYIPFAVFLLCVIGYYLWGALWAAKGTSRWVKNNWRNKELMLYTAISLVYVFGSWKLLNKIMYRTDSVLLSFVFLCTSVGVLLAHITQRGTKEQEHIADIEKLETTIQKQADEIERLEYRLEVLRGENAESSKTVKR